MSDENELSRRSMLQTTGSMAALGGCANSLGGESNDPAAATTQKQRVANVPTVDGDVIRTDHLLTDSRSADVIVWKDDDGTVSADGADEVIASGDSFSTVVQAAVDAGASKIVIQDGHYVADAQINLTSGTIVTGMGTDTTIEVADNTAFNLEGSRTGSSALTSDVEPGDQSIPVADTGAFEVGGYVLINSDRTTDYRDQVYGEIHRVTGIDSGAGSIQISAGGLFDPYATTENATAYTLDMVEDVAVRDMEIVGTDQQVFRSGVIATYGKQVSVENCKMHDLSHSGVIFTSTIFSGVRDSRMFNIAYENRGVGYGVTLSDACRNVRVHNNVFYEVKNHGTTVGGSGDDGFPRLLTFSENEYYEDDADIHFGGVVRFMDNRFSNGSGGIITGADTTQVADCEFRNLTDDAIKNRGDPTALVVNDSSFRNVSGMGINLYSNPTGLEKFTVAGSDFQNVSGNAARFRTPEGFDCDFVGITENVVRNCGNNAFSLEEIGDSSIHDLNVIGNHFEDVDGYVVGAGSTDGPIRFLNNSVERAAEPYAAILGGSPNLVGGNDFRDYADRGLLLKAGGLVTGNSFSKGGNDAILVYEADNTFVAHNNFENTEGADINAIGATNCRFVRNDIATEIDASNAENSVRENFGHQTEATGVHTASGDGGRSFAIPHDLVGEPAVANVWAESADAAGPFYVSDKRADEVVVTYRDAPPRGSGNLEWGFEVTTYAE